MCDLATMLSEMKLVMMWCHVANLTAITNFIPSRIITIYKFTCNQPLHCNIHVFNKCMHLHTRTYTHAPTHTSLSALNCTQQHIFLVQTCILLILISMLAFLNRFTLLCKPMIITVACMNKEKRR